MNWQPIDSAPKGTMLLMCAMNATEARHWAFVDWLDVDGRPVGVNGRKPTHWMNLPEPPWPAPEATTRHE